MSFHPETVSQPQTPATSAPSPREATRGWLTAALLIGILIVAAFFRFYGRDFDQGHNQHPDERFIVGKTIALYWPSSPAQFFDVDHSPLNLRQVDSAHPQGDHYPYGSFPVFLTKSVGWLADTILPPTDTTPKGYYLTDYNGVTKVGRMLAAFFDLVTVFLVFLIGRRLYGRKTGLVAAALVAFAVTQIQIAHFYASDTFLVTFMMGALYFSVVLMQRPSWWAAIGAGACLGLAVASKVSVVPFALIVLAAVVLRTGYRKRTRKLGAELDDPVGVRPAGVSERDMSFGRHLRGGLGYVLLAAVFAFLFFSISEPYVILLPAVTYVAAHGLGAVGTGLANARDAFVNGPFWQGIVEQAGIQSGQADFPYTRQYIGTTPVLYQMQQMVLWGLSPIPGIVTLVGFAVGLWNAFRKRPAEILLMSGAIPYFATILTLESKWMRYTLPLVPIFCLLGAALLMRGVAWMQARTERTPWLKYSRRPFVWAQRNVFQIITALVVGGAFLWAVAFMNIYTQEHSRVQASRWIYANVPATITENGAERQTHTSGEEWDDLLPLDVPPSLDQPGHNNGIYAPTNFRMYEDQPPDQEVQYIKGLLQQTDYIFIASNRLYGSLRHEPWRYPVQNKFYELLYAGKLGYELVHTSHVTPQLFGINFDDETADESFTVYDHPRVDIFKKSSNLTDEQMRIMFSDVLNRPAGSYSSARHDTTPDDKSLQYNQPVSSLGDLNDYAWNPLAQPDTQWIGVLLWLLAAEVLGLIALPIVFTIARRLPDRGYPIAKIAGLILVSWGVWVVSSAHLVPFTLWGITLVLLAVLALSNLCWSLGAREAIRDFWAHKRRLIVYYEALFLLAFLAFLFIRMLNPDLWHPTLGGEKPMEFGFLNATLRSPWMPPADPFFANGYINYYYYGQFVMAVMMKLIGVDPGLGVNLAVPLLYAFAFTAGASLVYNIVAWSRNLRGAENRVSGHGMAFGVVSGVLMLVIGNMHMAYQWIMINQPTLGDDLISFARTHGFTEQSMLTKVTTYDFWGPSRIISHTINEFPFWSFLFADFHPHLIDMPFTLMAAVLALNLAFAGPFRARPTVEGFWSRAGAAMSWLWGQGWSGALMFGVLAVTLGTLFATNSWDWPTFAAVAAAGVLVALLLASARTTRHVSVERQPTAPEPGRVLPIPWEQRLLLWGSAVVTTGVLAGASLVAALPFLLSFKNVLGLGLRFLVDGAKIPDVPLPAGQPVPFDLQMHRTTLGEFLMIWALFVFVALSYLAVRLWNFPWRAAVADVSKIFVRSGSRTPGGARAFSPDAALSLTRREGRLHPAFATASGMAFASDTRDELQPDLASGEGVSTGIVSGEHRASALDEEPIPQFPADGDGTYRTPESEGTTLSWVATAHDRSRDAERDAVKAERPGVIPLWAGLGLLLVTAGLVALQIATGQFVLALLLGLIGGIVATTLSTSRSAAAMFTGVLLVAALSVALGVELVYLADHLRGGDSYRMNTVFKFYVQVWLLWGGGCAAAIYYILFGLRDLGPAGAGASARDYATDYSSAFAGGSEQVTHALTTGIAPIAAGFEGADAETVAATDLDVTAAETAFEGNGHSGEATAETPVHTGPLNNWLVWNDWDEQQSAGANLAPVEAGSHSYAPKYEPPATESSPAWPEPASVSYPEEPTLDEGWSLGRLVGVSVWSALLGLFLVASLAFTIFGTQNRVAQRFPVTPPFGTLDGRAYMQYGTYGPVNIQKEDGTTTGVMINLKYDYEAVQWLNQHVPGLRIIAEGPYEYYRDGGMRAAANTGLPMIVGGLHQSEQRYDWVVGAREGESRLLFSTPDPQVALTILSKYDVDYIYLGQLEQARAGDGIAKFDQMARAGLLKEVFRSDNPADVPGTIIYQVVKNDRVSPQKAVGAPVQGSGVAGISITPLPTLTPTPAPTPPSDNPELKALIDAVNADPTNIDKERALADWYRDRKFFVAAAQVLETMKQQRPQDIAIRHLLGDAYQDAGQPDKALAEWQAARDVDPNNPAAHNKLGIAYLDRHRYDEAISEFQAAVKLDPLFNEAALHLGQAYDAKGDRPNAIKAYQQCVNAWKNAPADRKQGMAGWAQEAQRRIGQ